MVSHSARVNVEENGHVLWYKVKSIPWKSFYMSNQVTVSQTRDLTETEIVDSLVVSADVQSLLLLNILCS